MEESGFESLQGRRFRLLPSILMAVVASQYHIQCVVDSFFGVKVAGVWSWPLTPCSAQVKNSWRITTTPPYVFIAWYNFIFWLKLRSLSRATFFMCIGGLRGFNLTRNADSHGCCTWYSSVKPTESRSSPSSRQQLLTPLLFNILILYVVLHCLHTLP
jgi:hypothetical protein